LVTSGNLVWVDPDLCRRATDSMSKKQLDNLITLFKQEKSNQSTSDKVRVESHILEARLKEIRAYRDLTRRK